MNRPLAPPASLLLGLALVLGGNLAIGADADSEQAFDLSSRLQPGDAVDVSLELEVGGELIVADESNKKKRLPLSAEANLAYRERLLQVSPTTLEGPSRSVRFYESAQASITTEEQTVERTLPSEKAVVVAEWTDAGIALHGLEQPLARDQLDLINAIGNTLVIDRLLPGKSLADGQTWKNDQRVMGVLLGMDTVRACEVSSVVAGLDNGHVQIRMAGSVHGEIDGARSEVELKGAYLFHLASRRITRFNMAVKEQRAPGGVAPGLDVTAKLTLSIKATPASAKQLLSADQTAQARRIRIPRHGELVVESPQRGYRFRHSGQWYVTADQRELLSLRYLNEGKLIAHCNITTLPARSAQRAAKLAQFEHDVRISLGDKFDAISAKREWTTKSGHRCLAVFANGKVRDVPVQWRYYLVTAENRPRASVSVTVEQSLLKDFADADRAIVDSLDLIEQPAAETAAKD